MRQSMMMMMNPFPLQFFALIFFPLYTTTSLLTSDPMPANATIFPSTETNASARIRLALLAFKSSLVDPQGSLSSWDPTGGQLPYCKWRGIVCGRRHPMHVIALDLNSLGLSGSISPIVSNLTFLTRLHLQDNQLHGNIPEEIGRLSHLRYLNLSVNHLEGEMPASLLSHCSNLQIISISDNKLSGEIPFNLTRCFNLRKLSLANNMLDGEIPTEIGSLPAIQFLNLGGNNLRGRIPPLLGSSTWLNRVELWNNSIIGSIPPFLSNCSTLHYLDVGGNNLIGGIPPSFGNSTSLVILDLSRNQLTGVIPPHINHISPLVYLSFQRNLLTGQIPPSLGNLSSLRYLNLKDNSLEGSIPQSLGNIPWLQELGLSFNRLSNEIPSSLYNVSTITNLAMGNNWLSGTLPPDFGITLPNLSILRLFGNQLQGPIPSSMANVSGLVELNLVDNSFSGTVPSNLGSLGNLHKLHLTANLLTSHDWSFLTSLTNCSLLEMLGLSYNDIGGALPTSVGNLSTRLEWLLIARNSISGTIPSEIGNLVNLVALMMDQNFFIGSIPSSIGKLLKVRVLDLSRNKLSGPIPSAIGNLDLLITLDIGDNKLIGDIPTSFGGCISLEFLNLSHNALGGSIPRELLTLSSLTRGLDISHNALIGSIPIEIGNLINLGIFNVSENQLFGDIPPALGACKHLEQLHMDGNFFQGNIPQSFINLKGLKELDLSRNNLTGRIPNFLEFFGSLQSLNLSSNDFEGEVPNNGGVFRDPTKISIFGNKKLCGGHPKLRLPICTTVAPKRGYNPFIIIMSIISAVIMLLLSLIGVLYMRKKKTGVKGSSPMSTVGYERYRKITYAHINKATEGFSQANLLGTGSFGYVYKGRIDFEESFIAVKVLKLFQKEASRSFTAECEALRNIRHRNLVRIITACSSVDYKGNDFKALIFEYMPNGSLEKWLHPEVDLDQSQPQKLTLIQRLNIAIDVACALDYLHHSCQPPVVHCDLKPSNILIDNDMVAHVGDFGLARILSKSISVVSNNSTSSMGIKGTVGYVAPEYGMGGQVSTQGDAYSFGVMLLEMLTGKKPTDDMFKDGLNLRKFVEIAFREDIMKVLDPQLVSRGERAESGEGIIANERRICRERYIGCVISLIRIGLLCSDDAPRERMVMREALTEIHKIKEQFSIGEDMWG